MNNVEAQVVIIGAGPGGITTSMFLSKYKIAHVLVDKKAFPRDKVCGENMDGRVPLTLKKIDPNVVEELKQARLIEETHDFSINLPKGKIPISFKKDSTPRMLSKRIDFDAFLFKRATTSEYCTLLNNQVLKDYRYEGDQIIFEGSSYEIKAKIAVIACGYQSKLLKNRKADKQIYFFNRFYYRNAVGFANNQVQTYYFESPVNCCLLIVPLPNNEFNIELGIDKEDYKKNKVRLEVLLDQLIAQNKELRNWFSTGVEIDKQRGVHLPISSSKKYFSDPNILYVGTSSFCVNPITGMGIGNAMVMGEVASIEIKNYVSSPNFSPNDTKSYRLKAKKRLRNVFILNAVINFFFRYLKYTTPILMVMVRSKYLQSILSHTELLQNVSKPGFYLKKLFNRS